MCLLGAAWDFAHLVYICFVNQEKAHNLVPWLVLGDVGCLGRCYGQFVPCMNVVRAAFAFSVLSFFFPLGVGLKAALCL